MEVNTPTIESYVFNTTSQEYKFILPFEWDQIILPTILNWIFFVFGIVSNSLTVAVIMSFRELSSPFMLVLLSLCFTDLLSAVISPLSWYRRTYGFEYWALSTALCKIFWVMEILAAYATGLHILYYAVMRYVHTTVKKGYRINPRKTKIALILMWAISIAVSAPIALFFGVNERQKVNGHLVAKWPSCTAQKQWAFISITYFRVARSIFLGFPFCLVIVVSIMIAIQIRGHILRSSRKYKDKKKAKRRMRERYGFIQLVLIVTAFLFSYLPIFVYHWWSSAGPSKSANAIKIDYWFGFVQYLVMRLAETINPVLYHIGSPKMRRCTREYIRRFMYHFWYKSTKSSESSVSTVHTTTTIAEDNRKTLSVINSAL